MSEDTGLPSLRSVMSSMSSKKANLEKKEFKNLLIKRGAEWPTPDFMRINARHVVLIEPVSPNSRVAQLIKEAKAAKPSGTIESK
jgi:hypothetical protein